MTNLSKNEARVCFLNNKIEVFAARIESLVTPTQCDIILDRLFAFTRPLRQNTGVDRGAFERIKTTIETTTPEKFIMDNMEA